LQNRTVSVLIGEMVRAVRLIGQPDRPALEIDAANRLDLRFLQRLTWHYVIMNPRLSTQQAGQERMIEGLFDFFYDAAERADTTALPARLSHLLEAGGRDTPARIASDAVAGLSDSEASALYRRISGISSGSVLDGLRL
jgi:dGTPase